jgi:chromosome segregation ATPase
MPESPQFCEPVFDVGQQHWPVLSDDDILALENTIARQSAELNQRLTEVIDLYNIRQQQANQLQAAREEIDRLNQTVLTLEQTTARHKTDIGVAHDKIALLKNEKADLREQLDKALHDTNVLTGRLLATETTFKVREKNVVSAMQQVESMSSELTVASAERFKLVAALQAERKQHRSALNEKTSTLGDRLRRSEAAAENKERQIKNLEDSRSRLNERVSILETLLKSEREVAESKIKRLTDVLQRDHIKQSDHRPPSASALSPPETLAAS